jgi:foldase protein PrsA
MSVIKQNKKMVGIIVVLILAIGVLLSFGLTKDKAIAKVDGDAISKDELYDVMVQQYGSETVDQLIAEKIVALEAKKEKVLITDSELNEEIEKLKESYGGEEIFEQVLQSNNTTLETIKEDLKNYLTIKALIEPQIEISDEELKTYFDENKDSLGEAEQVKASHILVADETKAKEIKEKLAGGEDFAALAKEFSTDEGSKENGGELGFFPKGTMVEEFEEIAFSMAVNTISDPVKTEYGYHIIKVEDKKEAVEANFDDSKEQIKETLLEEKINNEYPTWLETKKKDYDIENTLETEIG